MSYFIIGGTNVAVGQKSGGRNVGGRNVCGTYVCRTKVAPPSTMLAIKPHSFLVPVFASSYTWVTHQFYWQHRPPLD